jgi:DNA-binding MarR family transcriptional regulator
MSIRARPACCRSVIWVSSDAWEGVSSAQEGVLFLLTSRSEAAVGEIAEALRVAPAAVTNLSKRTQAGGLIERVGDADDGRLTRLRLTLAGKAASAQSSVLLQRLNRQLTTGFSPDELAVVARWLEHAGQLPGQAPAGD